MKVVITGASGLLGSKVVQFLQNEYVIHRIGRNVDEYPWQLGVRLDPAQFQDINAMVHFAWSLSDRRNDANLNVGGTAEIARFANELGIPFIFVSSVAAAGDSFYGRSKRCAEEYVTWMGGVTFRVGLVLDSNRYLKNEKRYKVRLVPKINGRIPLTDLSILCKEISKVIDGSRREARDEPAIVELVTGSISINDFFGTRHGLNLRVPKGIIVFLLNFCSVFSLKARNYQDAFHSLISTLQKE